MGYKIKRFFIPRDRIGPAGYTYEARDQYGWIGIGPSPARAVLDLRHEYRQGADAAEMGKCRRGVFHKW